MSRWILPVFVLLAAGLGILSVRPRPSRAAEGETPAYPHGEFRGECGTCHSSEGWGLVLVGDAFDHAKYGMALEGAHAETPCRTCHGDLDFTVTTSLCADCHQDVHEAEFGLDCARCHSTRSFVDRTRMEKEHQLTRFPLTGSHAVLDCESCHGGSAGGTLSFVTRSTECAACHGPDFEGTRDPDHVEAGFPRTCDQCHGTMTWANLDFDHAITDFPLTGAHATRDCADCHGSRGYTNVSTACVDCHRSDYDDTVDPDHFAGGFPLDCETCHSTSGWPGADFDHDLTEFPLTGAHGTTDCASCHGDGRYTGTRTECAACHQADYDDTTDPDHFAAGFSLDCSECHGTDGFAGASFDHSLTEFALTGGHLGLECVACHEGGTYEGRSQVCASCHQADYDDTTNPDHFAAGFPLDCAACHGVESFEGGEFDHGQTEFALTGAHFPLDCASCHEEGVYDGRSQACASCHQSDYDGTTDPDHLTAGFPLACETCHGTSTFEGAEFDHGQTEFALTGAHAPLQCASCHGDGVFAGRSMVCASCHQSDYDQTLDPDHLAAGFSLDCASCHGTTAFEGASFDHDQTDFALTGAHVPLNCASCHGDGEFDGRSTACASCHQGDYDGTTEPDHLAAGFSLDCAGCHGTSTFEGAGFDHSVTDFALTGAHQVLGCGSCHGDGVYDGRSVACVSCHQSDYEETTEPDHLVAGFPLTCDTCHGTATFEGATFDHSSTLFPLTGAHGPLDCASCHGDGVFDGRSTACASCHQPDYDNTTNPDHLAAGFSLDCAECHGTAAFAGATFDHGATQFPLTGAHGPLDCASCHGDGVYDGRSLACVSCHQGDYDGTTDPDHLAAGFPMTCDTCHGTTTFQGAGFDHSVTEFPLSGAHTGLECLSCHGDGVFDGRSTACVSCHQSDYDNTTDPDHLAAGFPMTCDTCHGTTTFEGADFDHGGTQFPLTGAHVPLDCSSCHGDGVFDGKSTACVSCHQSDYDNTTDPDHLAAGFPMTCDTCHGTTTFEGADFDHGGTQFPLTGAHVPLNCSSCHGDGVFDGKSTACVSCHQSDYDDTTDPDHLAAGFPMTCDTCHGTTTFEGATFDHSSTQFPLTGAHVPLNCSSCHGDGVFDGKATACVSCHQSDYDNTTDPDHLAAGFPMTCDTCHGTTTFQGAGFDHSVTQFPLTGAHTALECLSCHGDGVFDGRSTACVSCHQSDYDNTTDPDHLAAGFPMTCDTCHGTTTFDGATFDHSSTQFPLTGAHVPLNCSSCHGDGVFDGKATACVSCHQSDYDNTTDPDHLAAGFPMTCDTCHGTTTFQGAGFDHSVTQFPLTGAHTALECLSCHGDGVFDGRSTACVSCHQSDYDNTTDPDHLAAGFPMICDTCHGTTTFEGATFDHSSTQFPLTGAHVPLNCSSCHGDGVFDGKSTACVSCHQSDYDNTTDPDHLAAGFPMTCDTCHGTTTFQGAGFDHSVTQFPLTGAHTVLECLSCHGDGVFDGKSTACVSCHQSDYDNTTDPDHLAAGFPMTCDTCHGTTTFEGATFDHSSTQFPLTGAHVPLNCSSCHGDGVFDGKSTACVSCHQSDYDNTTDPDHLAAGFPMTCDTCHGTTTFLGAGFDHSVTEFPLTGAHTALECLSCHGDGVFDGKSTACVSCHQSDYDNTTDPDHLAAGFPMTCDTCHGTTTFEGATFNHDGPWFPIYSGKHRDKWDTCADCHLNPANFQQFFCLGCHPHSDKSKTDGDHSEENGYQYDSQACYSCHPRGN